MPNTIAHIGVQTLVSCGVLRNGLQGADVKWIWLGCVIPDLPWILQRVLRMAAPDLSPYDLRLYAIAQSALFLCLVFSAACACFAMRPGRIFAVLGLGCLMHLVLDAAQTKWANGVHLFAPASWELLNFGLFWPEDWPTWALTALGLMVAAHAFHGLARKRDPGAMDLRLSRARVMTAAALLAVYMAAPLGVMGAVEASDSHYAGTLRDAADRPGREIGFDRARLGEDGIIAWTGEVFAMTGVLPDDAAKASVRGRFESVSTIEVTAYHIHPQGVRDGVSYLGLGFVALWWIVCLWRRIAKTDRAGAG